MARVQYVEPSELAPEDRFLLERPINLFKALANNPEAMKIFRPIGRWIRHECPLDPRLRELAILQVGYVANCAYEFSHHVKISRDFGVTPDDIEAMIAENEGKPSSLGPLDREVLRAARSITSEMQMADETWSYLRDKLGEERLIELVLVVSYYNHVVRVLKTLKIDVEPEWSKPLSAYASPEGEWR